MGEHAEEFNKQQQVRRARVTALTLASFLIIALVSIVFAFIQSKERERITQELLQSKQAQVELHEKLKKAEEQNAMLQYRVEHLERSLENQTKIAQELIKRSK